MYAEPDVKTYNATSGVLTEDTKYKQKIYFLNAYYDFKNSSPLTPFIGAGVGKHDWEATSKETAYALHGGANYNINKNLYIGAKGSYFRTIESNADGVTGASERFSDMDSFAVNALLGYEF